MHVTCPRCGGSGRIWWQDYSLPYPSWRYPWYDPCYPYKTWISNDMPQTDVTYKIWNVSTNQE
ncbi:MAG: hypothetical protein ACYTEQ_26360, partial [Planctomycetota bacterium]